MRDKDTQRLIEAYMSHYLSSNIGKPAEFTIYSKLDDLLKGVASKKLTRDQAIDKIRSIQEELVEVSEQLRIEDMNDIANRLSD